MSQITPDILWPPPYKIKKHRLAKHVKLRTSKPHGLEITVPYRFNLKDIPAILEENKTWVLKQIQLWQLKQQSALPDSIELLAIGEVWAIHTLACDAKLEIIQRPHHEMVLVGDIKNIPLAKKILITWLKGQAKTHLVAQLQHISEQIQLSYENVSVRDQRTLWGSCTVNKSISLNYKLMFLPPALVAHVMIHELCHTVYLNHSDKFWALVARHDVLWREHRRALRRADQYMPMWLS